MDSIFLKTLKLHANEVAQTVATLKKFRSDQDTFWIEAQKLKTEGTSSFSIREAAKRLGMIDAD